MFAGIYSRFGPFATLGEQFIEDVNTLQGAIHGRAMFTRTKSTRGMIGGSVTSRDQIFALEAAKHHGCAVKRRGYCFTRIDSELREKPNPNDASESESQGLGVL